MEFIPAIDILDGKVVRLKQGRYDDVTVYADDPLEPARRFVDAGARRLHVVDLDGARDGSPKNTAIIERLAALALAVQVGGGIRDRQTAERLFTAGVTRVVLGTAAVRDSEFVRELASERSVVVAADARDGKIAVEGWREGTGVSLEALAADADQWGVEAVLYTSIERDGMREGPDVEGTSQLQALLTADVIASGGIGTLDHVRALRDAGVRSCVSGRALYGNAFSVEEAIQLAEARS